MQSFGGVLLGAWHAAHFVVVCTAARFAAWHPVWLHPAAVSAWSASIEACLTCMVPEATRWHPVWVQA